MQVKQLLSDRIYMTGIIFILVSLLWFSLPWVLSLSQDNSFGMFFGNYALTVAYFIILWSTGRLKRGRNGLYPLFLFLILFLISAWSLNREMNVFEDSVSWFTALQVFICINYIAFAFFDQVPVLFRHVMNFILGIAFIVFVYLSCYLLPLYAIGFIGALLLGFSLHTIVPLLFCIYTIRLIRKKATENKKYWLSFSAGIAIPLVITIAVTVQWNSIVVTMNKTYRNADLVNENGLPAWVTVAQNIPHGIITEKILKTGIVYSVPETDNQFDDLFWRVPFSTFDERRKHDPLVMTAALLGGNPMIPSDKRIRILESIYDSRHQAQERLWSGDNLFTDHIKTIVRLWPQFSLSYTEKFITVFNNQKLMRWNDEEEAIYTFHLPEGGVVTSLSLWIEGKESKGLLTTREKAETAYRTIVGRERRDPSVVHWQEGNTVSVRVFPVMAQDNRLFKIGITAPLARKHDKLVYQNIYFDGPSVAKATEEILLDFEKAPKDFISSASFSTESTKSYKTSGKYVADWSIEVAREPLSATSFSFNGKSFSVDVYEKKRVSANINIIYLDVNASWNKDEYERVTRMFGDKTVYVYDNGIREVNEKNKNKIFERLHKKKFSLFPLNIINDPSGSLLVTKSTPASPNLSDLKETPFMASLKNYLQGEHKIRLFNLGLHLSPYLRSLKEYRVFEYEDGDVNELGRLIASKTFAMNIENNEVVVVDNAGITISCTEGTETTGAPDHLMRLFAYNHIMQKMGGRLITADSLNSDLVDIAKEAYIVSPVSSLVVLETQKDYERFNISESANSLKNASVKSKGAVPEPHEWALIIIGTAVVFYFRFQPKLIRK